MVSLTPVKEAFTIVIDNGGEFLSGVVGTAGAHSKTVKASLTGVVDSSEKFLSRVNDAGNTSFTDVIDTCEAPK